jgi:SYP5 family syntaxin
LFLSVVGGFFLDNLCHREARASRANAGRKAAMDASTWLAEFERVEKQVDASFACLYESDAAQREGRASDATELTATVRKQAAELGSTLDKIESSLRTSSVTERERRRRDDLVVSLRGRCEELEGLSGDNTGFVSSPASTSFFQPELDSHHRGETSMTVDLDNSGILQLQRNMMAQQDDELEELSRVVTSTKHIGMAVNEELGLHARLLDDIDDEVTRTGSRLKQAHKMALAMYKKTSNCRLFMIATLCLVILMLLVFAVLKRF